MKKVLLFSALLLIIHQDVSAETIVQGGSSVSTTVSSNVNTTSNTESSSHTRIEIEVNGEKKVLDTNEQGTHTLSIESGGGTNSATVSVNSSVGSQKSAGSSVGVDISEQARETIGGDGEIISKESEKKSLPIIIVFIEKIVEVFDKIFPF